MPETLTDAQKVLRNDTGKRMAAALETLASGVEPSTVIAPEYDPAQTYAVGDLVMYKGSLYRCTTAITTPEAWTPGHWAATSVSDITMMTAKADEVGIVINGNTSSIGASVGQYVFLRNSTISGRADGLYTAAQAIPANTPISASYLTAVSNGGLNDMLRYVSKSPTLSITTDLEGVGGWANVMQIGYMLVFNFSLSIPSITPTQTYNIGHFENFPGMVAEINTMYPNNNGTRVILRISRTGDVTITVYETGAFAGWLRTSVVGVASSV